MNQIRFILSHYSLVFLLDVYSIEDYSMIQKVKAENENFKALSMKMEVDEDGIPKMDYELAMKYYNQACGNLPDGIGLILSPFAMADFFLLQAEHLLKEIQLQMQLIHFGKQPVHLLIFGSTKATSSASLGLSVKPDEAIAFFSSSSSYRDFSISS